MPVPSPASFSADVAAWGFYGLLLAVAVPLLWSTIAGRDLWPFSHYPMFGRAPDASAVRFFRLRVHLDARSSVALTGAADPLADTFHREFERLWEDGPIAAPAADDVVLRCWREACRLDGALAAAERIEVTLRIAQLVRGGGIAVMEKPVHVVTVGGRADVA